MTTSRCRFPYRCQFPNRRLNRFRFRYQYHPDRRRFQILRSRFEPNPQSLQASATFPWMRLTDRTFRYRMSTRRFAIRRTRMNAARKPPSPRIQRQETSAARKRAVLPFRPDSKNQDSPHCRPSVWTKPQADQNLECRVRKKSLLRLSARFPSLLYLSRRILRRK